MRAAALLVCLACTLVMPGLRAGSDRDVLSAVRRYVAAYERELVAIVGIEDYAQSIVDVAGIPARRELRSELGWVYLPDVRETIGLREVRQVNGTDVPDAGNRLQRLLMAPAGARGSDDDIRALLEESARYNLGEDSRNFNFPTFPLIYLRDANRDRSSWKVRTADGTFTRIEFKEQDRATIVKTARATNVPARGTCRVESISGRVDSCHVTLTTPDRDRLTTYTIDVTFAPDVRLGVWLPASMHDDYRAPATRVVGEATYSGFRRFETGGRLVR
jgi:hypothetical protein